MKLNMKNTQRASEHPFPCCEPCGLSVSSMPELWYISPSWSWPPLTLFPSVLYNLAGFSLTLPIFHAASDKNQHAKLAHKVVFWLLPRRVSALLYLFIFFTFSKAGEGLAALWRCDALASSINKAGPLLGAFALIKKQSSAFSLTFAQGHLLIARVSSRQRHYRRLAAGRTKAPLLPTGTACRQGG